MDQYTALRHKHATPVIVEDLTQGLNEWRNIQDIVRVTFKAFHDVLKAQGDAIKTLERVMDTKANRNEVASALAAKASAADLSGRMHDLESMLFRKADVTDMNKRALTSEVEQVLGARLGDVSAGLDSKPSFTDLDHLKEHADISIANMQADIARLHRSLVDMKSEVADRATVTEVSQALRTKADQAEVDAVLARKVDRATFVESQAKKTDNAYVDQMETDLKASLNEISSRLADKCDTKLLEYLQDSTELQAQRCESSLKALTGNVARVEARVAEEEGARRDALSKKADVSEVYRVLEKKSDIAHVEEALRHKADSSTVAVLAERNEMSSDVAGRLILLKEEMVQKANVKDVCALLDVKANTEDVNKVLVDVCNELDRKAAAEDLQSAVRDQSIMNASLCVDMSFGRWIWKSGKTKAGNGVPWNIQSLNTDPDNFIWEKDKATIMTIAPGLYELTFGFFAKKRPAIQVLVNGDPVLSAINNNSYVTHHSSGRLTTVSNHPAGNVTGLTCIDFLALPPKARVAITFQGDEKGEGFIALKKL